MVVLVCLINCVFLNILEWVVVEFYDVYCVIDNLVVFRKLSL